MRKKRIHALSFLVISALALIWLPKIHAAPEGEQKVTTVSTASDWSPAVNISNTNMHSFTPLVGVDKDGKAYAVWMDWTDVPRLVYSNTNKSGQWNNRIRVHIMEHYSVEAGFPALQTAPDGTCHLIFHDVIESYEILYYQFKDGAWKGPENVSETQEGGSVYSTLALSPADNYLYAVWMDEVINMWDLMFSYREPNSTRGWDWGVVLPLLNGMQYMPSATVDGKGTLHLVFITRDGENSSVWYAKNTQPRNHSNWTRPIVIAHNVGIEWSYPRIASDNHGDVYVVWNGRSAQGYRDVFLRKTVNQSWQDIENVSQSQNSSEAVAVAASRATGEFYVSWQEAVSGNWEVYLRAFEQTRAREEKRWSSVVNISNNSSASGFPRLAVAENGDVHLVYADRMTGIMEIYYTLKYKILVFPPVDVTLKTSYNKVLFYNEKINTITFGKNPKNDDSLITSYKIYRKLASEANDKFQLLATLSSSTFRYDDRQLPHAVKYAYTVTTRDVDGNESRILDVVTEQ